MHTKHLYLIRVRPPNRGVADTWLESTPRSRLCSGRAPSDGIAQNKGSDGDHRQVGIKGKREQQHTQNTLTDEAVKYAQIIVNTTRRKRATLNRRQETDRPQQPATHGSSHFHICASKICSNLFT